MRKSIFAAAAMAPLLCGCADLATGLAMYADQLDAEQGYYYDDTHQSQRLDGDCPSLWEYGIVNNQTYQRVRNQGSRTASYRLIWSSGYETSAYLEPGQTSEFFYMTPSIRPDQVDITC
jgi:hypothetical protein